MRYDGLYEYEMVHSSTQRYTPRSGGRTDVGGLILAAVPVAVSLLLSPSVLEGKEDEHVISMLCLLVLVNKQQPK